MSKLIHYFRWFHENDDPSDYPQWKRGDVTFERFDTWISAGIQCDPSRPGVWIHPPFTMEQAQYILSGWSKLSSDRFEIIETNDGYTPELFMAKLRS